jgi:hypothetical protein
LWKEIPNAITAIQRVSFAGILYGYGAVVPLLLVENVVDAIFRRLRFDDKRLGDSVVVQPSPIKLMISNSGRSA